MVISQIMGGLGNQLSEYACGYSLAKYLGQELVLDVSDYMCKGYFRPYCLDKLQIGRHRKLVYPPESVEFMTEEGIPKELRNSGMRIIDTSKCKDRESLLEAARGADDIYLMGYGGVHYCTEEDRKEIIAKYQMKTPSAVLKLFEKRIGGEYSVAVHLRRTDFVALEWQDSAEYFRAAISYVRIFHPDAQFYFFSDDIQYAKETFGGYGNYHYVHLLGGMDADLEEFFCMSACNGRIVSTNSTFSAWACELNQKEDKLEIRQTPPGENKMQIYLNKDAINNLCCSYKTEDGTSGRTDVSAAIDTVFHLVSEGCNDQAIEVIDQLGFDSYGLSEEDTRRLTMLKEIALAQKGDAGLREALRSFYKELQWEHENLGFHADYFRALYQAGRFAESAIHAALANRLGDPEDYREYFENAETLPFVRELYRFLKSNPVRHFIFVPVQGWNNYITYMKSLAALLAQMGQKVTFLQPSDMSIECNGAEEQAAKILLQYAKPVDGCYKYHIDMVCMPSDIFSKEKRDSLFSELIRQCIARFDMQTVVVTTVPDVFLTARMEDIKYVVPDICDPLNCERIYFENDLTDYIFHMADQADTIFLSGSVYETVRKQYGAKVRRALPVWNHSKCQFLDMELDYTPNYIHSDEMIGNAAALLMA